MVDPVRFGNVYFTGIAGGFLDNFFGFGSLKAIFSGLLAGKCIANNLEYQDITKSIIKTIKKKREFRTAVDNFDNRDFDRILSIMSLPGIKQLIFNNPIFKVTQGTFIPKIYNKFTRK